MSAGLSGQPPLAGWAPFAVVLAVSAALLGFDLGGRVLATNDEARFPMMARDIVSNGHWLLPEISGVPMLNKPPLHAWLIALGAWPTGAVSQRTAVVPSFLGALGLVAVTYWIAQRVFGAGAGLAAGLIVATTAGVFAMARSAVPDMTLSFGIAAAMAAFVAAELDGRRGAWLGFYGLVGVACWAKGPAGLMPLVVVVAYQLAASGWRGLTRLRAGMGIAILGVVVAPWWLPASCLVPGGLWSGGVCRQMAFSVTAWGVVASTLVFGEVYVTAGDNRGTELRTIARALERVSAQLFALEAPELVFSFYLGRSIPVVSSTAELRGGDPPVYVIARNPSVPEAFDPVAQGFVKGRRFVLWSKQ